MIAYPGVRRRDHAEKQQAAEAEILGVPPLARGRALRCISSLASRLTLRLTNCKTKA